MIFVSSSLWSSSLVTSVSLSRKESTLMEEREGEGGGGERVKRRVGKDRRNETEQ